MFRQWSWRCQWIWMMMVAAALIFYNVWVLRPAITCPTPALALLPPTNTSQSTCESCLETTTITPQDDPFGHLDLRLGRWDTSHNYKIFDYAAMGEFYPDISSTRYVCLATQSSIESLHEILKIGEHWSGPVSVAVYIAGDEMRLLQAFVTWLFTCQPEFFSRLALHITSPEEKMAEFGRVLEWAQNCSAEPRGIPLGDRAAATTEYRAKTPYPQNILRNVARKNCQTSYVYMVDVDIVPCKDMAESLEKFLLSEPECSQCAYVIPTYELDWSVSTFPENKTKLLQWVEKDKAIPFHKKVFIYNQLSSDLHKWEAHNKNESSETHISHEVDNYRMLYEPFYVAHDNTPPHEERFVGYGSTRNSQVYEMYLIGYQFKVLSPIFTIHWGLQSKQRPKWRRSQIWKNYKKFKTFKKELYARHGKDPLHFFTKPKRTSLAKPKHV